ncbi:MAG: Sapep family Mn(2+)-dependent dipeptidase [Oscillospiraceae bacterium]|nr:Sapep family Mn(2+)-dependent dipeptidase [Oscillospiraceae bacterium]MBQ4240347.1 Sapep family Mn(2+)-dependent dipeptidase [Oscillospiraceae bacterium]
MNSALIEKVNSYIDAHKDDIVRDLAAVASIESVSLDDSDVKPFGPGCRKVLDHMLAKGEAEGFKTHNYEYYVGSVKYDLGKEDTIGMLAHLDVVPAGSDWTVTEPYTPLLKDGYLFGRGVGDNKSAAIGGLYIMKALRDAGAELNHNLDLMLGTSEETGMGDMKYFTEHYECPKFTFVPDGGFPGVGGEFGRVRYTLTSNDTLSDDFLCMDAGSAFNIIPNKAVAVLKKGTAIDYNSLDPEKFTVTEKDDCVEVVAHGVTTHAAGPERGVNAVWVLTDGLVKLDGLKPEDKKIIEFMNNVNADYYGSFLGIDCTDEVSGTTVSSGTVLRYDNGHVSLLNDCRRAVTDNNDRLIENITKKAAEWNFSVSIQETSNGYALDVNGPVIQAIKKVYVDETGDTESVIGIGKGGTYAGALPRAFATGVNLRGDNRPELPQGHGSAHQPDEFIVVEDYIKGIKLLMKMILTVDEIL